MSLGVTSRSLRGISVAAALLAIGAAGCADDEAGAGRAFSLKTGDCYTPKGEAIEAVPCEEPHEGQVVGAFDIDDKDAFPGNDAVAVIADERCRDEAQKFAPDPWSLPQGVDVSYYHPTKASWAQGDRKVSCAYINGSDKFSGSLKRDPLTADQLTYIKGSTAVYDALWAHQPEGEEIEEDLHGYKVQAEAVRIALDAHVQSLRDIEKPETVRLREELEKAAGEWKKAASAGDADAFRTAHDAAFSGIDPNKTIAARKELELATTVPAEEAEGWA